MVRLFSRHVGTSFTCPFVHPRLVHPCLIRGNQGAGGDESYTLPVLQGAPGQSHSGVQMAEGGLALWFLSPQI